MVASSWSGAEIALLVQREKNAAAMAIPLFVASERSDL
jgi:hypothetical protein